MPIAQDLNREEFTRAFEIAKEKQFSPEALSALYDYLTRLSDYIGSPILLDVIGLCSKWSEESAEDIANCYGIDLSSCDDANKKEAAVMAHLQEKTTAIRLVDTILYKPF